MLGMQDDDMIAAINVSEDEQTKLVAAPIKYTPMNAAMYVSLSVCLVREAQGGGGSGEEEPE